MEKNSGYGRNTTVWNYTAGNYKQWWYSSARSDQTSKKKQKEGAAIQDAIQCMKTLTENTSNRDSFAVYGEHVAHKLWSCDCDYTITVAQHHIDNVLFNLGIGTYHKPISTPTFTHAFPSTSLSSYSSQPSTAITTKSCSESDEDFNRFLHNI